MVGSTAVTQQLGDAKAMRLLRRHDDIVRAEVRSGRGSEVKHTGDGIMASFRSVIRAVECAIAIQRSFAEHNAEHPDEAIAIRIGLAAGEPVTERGDLYGVAVQLAARLCARGRPNTILVSTAVHGLVVGHPFVFGTRKKLTLRGFDQPVQPTRSSGSHLPPSLRAFREARVQRSPRLTMAATASGSGNGCVTTCRRG